MHRQHREGPAKSEIEDGCDRPVAHSGIWPARGASEDRRARRLRDTLESALLAEFPDGWVNSLKLWSSGIHCGIAPPWRRAIFFAGSDSDSFCAATFPVRCDKSDSAAGGIAPSGISFL